MLLVGHDIDRSDAALDIPLKMENCEKQTPKLFGLFCSYRALASISPQLTGKVCLFCLRNNIGRGLCVSLCRTSMKCGNRIFFFCHPVKNSQLSLTPSGNLFRKFSFILIAFAFVDSASNCDGQGTDVVQVTHLHRHIQPPVLSPDRQRCCVHLSNHDQHCTCC